MLLFLLGAMDPTPQSHFEDNTPLQSNESSAEFLRWTLGNMLDIPGVSDAIAAICRANPGHAPILEGLTPVEFNPHDPRVDKLQFTLRLRGIEMLRMKEKLGKIEEERKLVERELKKQQKRLQTLQELDAEPGRQASVARMIDRDTKTLRQLERKEQEQKQQQNAHERLKQELARQMRLNTELELRAKANYEETQAMIEKLTERQDQSDKMIATLSRDNKDLRSRLASAEAACRANNPEAIAAYRKKCESLEQELEDRITKYETLSEQAQSVLAEKAELERMRQEVQDQLRKAEHLGSRLKSAQEDLEEKMSIYDALNKGTMRVVKAQTGLNFLTAHADAMSVIRSIKNTEIGHFLLKMSPIDHTQANRMLNSNQEVVEIELKLYNIDVIYELNPTKPIYLFQGKILHNNTDMVLMDQLQLYKDPCSGSLPPAAAEELSTDPFLGGLVIGACADYFTFERAHLNPRSRLWARLRIDETPIDERAYLPVLRNDLLARIAILKKEIENGPKACRPSAPPKHKERR